MKQEMPSRHKQHLETCTVRVAPETHQLAMCLACEGEMQGDAQGNGGGQEGDPRRC